MRLQSKCELWDKALWKGWLWSQHLWVAGSIPLQKAATLCTGSEAAEKPTACTVDDLCEVSAQLRVPLPLQKQKKSQELPSLLRHHPLTVWDRALNWISKSIQAKNTPFCYLAFLFQKKMLALPQRTRNAGLCFECLSQEQSSQLEGHLGHLPVLTPWNSPN